MAITEKALIQQIRAAAAKSSNTNIIGIGDDTAVLRLPRGDQALITTDFTLENVHFRRNWHPADAVGHRCLARGLSDIAAMGGRPQAAFLSLAVPSKFSQRWITGFIRGLLQLASSFDVVLAGGDTAQSPAGVLADIVVLGSVPSGRAILRSGARAGDLLYVTGTLGSSAATLVEMQNGKKVPPRSRLKHFYPQPRVEVGLYLQQKNLATAMIDISDGVSTDLGHICEESGAGAVVYGEALPRAPEHSLDFALHGGEEYELLFAAHPESRIPKRIAGVPITLIGEIVRRKGMKLARRDGRTQALRPGGWQHFSQ